MLLQKNILLYYYVVHLLSSFEVWCLHYRTGLPFALRTGRLGMNNPTYCCSSQVNHETPTLGEILTKSLLSARVAFNKNLLKELQDIRDKKNNETSSGYITPAPGPKPGPTGSSGPKGPTGGKLEIKEERFKGTDDEKALKCAQMDCDTDNSSPIVCACNYKTGNVVSFQNECDLKKHNCRFDTDFKVILQGVCPWQYESRRDGNSFNYDDKSYYN